MADFSSIINKILDAEGGYQNNPNDKGNWYKGKNLGTNLGIIPSVYADYLGRAVTLQDMLNITRATAIDIYRKRFWNKIKGDQINNQEVATIFFDGAVNHGTGRGTKLMQQALNELGENLSVDGACGPLTIAAINRNPANQVHNTYKQKRIDFYHYLVQVNSSQQVFLNGWMNRINSFIDMPGMMYSGSSNSNGTIDTAMSYVEAAKEKVKALFTENQKIALYAAAGLALLMILITLFTLK